MATASSQHSEAATAIFDVDTINYKTAIITAMIYVS